MFELQETLKWNSNEWIETLQDVWEGTNFVSNRELKITQKSPALVRASADENRQKFSEFNRVIMILHLLEI